MPELSLDDIVDRFRSNLRAASIALPPEDFEALIASGQLKSVFAFEKAVAGAGPGDLPEYPGESVPDPGAGKGPVGPVSRNANFGAVEGSPVSPNATMPSTAASAAVAALRLPIGEVAGLVARRELSPLELVRASLETVAERDPAFNAFQYLRPEEALSEARAAETEIAAGRSLGPLHGLPIAVKDLFDLGGLPTRAGSALLGAEPKTRDATAVARLRAAGAVVVGKTRMSEFAWSPGSNNDHYGPTRNPLAPDHDTGGSSSGSAAAVAAGLVLAALGSDTGGSIRIPASFCGLVGFKPSRGRIGLAGAFPLSWSLDHAGPLARSVADAALLAAILVGPDPADPRSEKAGALDGRLRPPSSLRGRRIGFVREEAGGKASSFPEVLAAWKGGLALLESAGAELVEVDLPEFAALRALNSAVLGIEATAIHGDFQRSRLGDYGAFPRLGLLGGWAYGPADLARASQALRKIRVALAAKLAGLDLLSTPTMVAPAPLLGQVPRLTYTSPFNILGWPAISLPAGRTPAGLPLGIQLIAGPGEDESLLGFAALLEQALNDSGS